LAFWAAGWHASVTWYKQRIYHLLKAMFRLVDRVLPPNRKAVDTYLAGYSIQHVELLLRSTQSAEGTIYDDPRLTEISDAFMNAEAMKMQEQLDGVLYELDDSTTLKLVTGPGRIERVSFNHIWAERAEWLISCA
jgi:hypothetical protein